MPDKTGYVKLSQDPVEDLQNSSCREICFLQKKAAFKKVLVVLVILQLIGIWSIYKRSYSYGVHSLNNSPIDDQAAFNGLSNVSNIFHLPLTQAKDMGRFYSEIDKKNLWCLTLGTEVAESSSARKCVCRSGWNGLDCGVPPAVWNSKFLQQGEREGILIRRRKRPRRLIYSTTFNGTLGPDVLNFTFQYLKDFVEVFVIADLGCSSQNLPSTLHSTKIVFLCSKSWSSNNFAGMQRKLWSVAKKKLSDFRTDDIVILSDGTAIPSKEALSFLKLYSGFSEPIYFSLLPVSDANSLGKVPGNVTSFPVSPESKVAACSLEFLRYVCRYEADLVWFATDSRLRKRVQRFEKNNWPVKPWVVGSSIYPAGWDCDPCLVHATPKTNHVNETSVSITPSA